MIEAHNITNLEGNSIESAVKTDFGLEINNAGKIEHGYSSEVYKAELGDDTVFIRINKDAKVFNAEVLGYEIFEKQGIPVPKIIAYKEHPQTIRHPAMIMSSAVGTTVGEADLSPEDKDVIYKKLGKLLNKIHETKLDGFGTLKVEDGRIVGEFPTWQAYREKQHRNDLKALDFSKEKNFVTEIETAKIKHVYVELASLDFGKASLLHKDLHQSHFFVKGTEITGVIDLGRILAGDPRYDIAMSLFFQNPRQQENFKKGYGELANDPVVNKYLITIAIRKIYFRSRNEVKGDVESLVPRLKEALLKLD